MQESSTYVNLHFGQRAIDERIFPKQNKTKQYKTKKPFVLLRIRCRTVLFIQNTYIHIHCLNTTPSRYTFLSLPLGTLLRLFQLMRFDLFYKSSVDFLTLFLHFFHRLSCVLFLFSKLL